MKIYKDYMKVVRAGKPTDDSLRKKKCDPLLIELALITFLIFILMLISIFGLVRIAGAEDMDLYAIKTIAYEASNQSFEAQVAVANVIKTRMKERRLTSKQIALQPYQFSCWKDGKPTQRRKLTEKELNTARIAWSESNVWQFNHYAHKNVSNYWTKKAVLKKQIGDHIFYKL